MRPLKHASLFDIVLSWLGFPGLPGHLKGLTDVGDAIGSAAIRLVPGNAAVYSDHSRSRRLYSDVVGSDQVAGRTGQGNGSSGRHGVRTADGLYLGGPMALLAPWPTCAIVPSISTLDVLVLRKPSEDTLEHALSCPASDALPGGFMFSEMGPTVAPARGPKARPPESTGLISFVSGARNALPHACREWLRRSLPIGQKTNESNTSSPCWTHVLSFAPDLPTPDHRHCPDVKRPPEQILSKLGAFQRFRLPVPSQLLPLLRS